MKTPYKNIYQILKSNRFVVISVVTLAFLSSCFSLVMIYNLNRQVLNTAFMVNTDGSVIPLKLVKQQENLEVEAKAHLELFHRYFYGLNPSNYEDNLKKALWLGNSSVDNVYKQKRAEGVYNRLLQFSLHQKVTGIESRVDLSKDPYRFQTRLFLEVNRGSVVDSYELITTGNLVRVERNFPKNTHGMLITDFYEHRLKKTTDENRKE